MQVQSRTVSCELCNDLHSNTDDSTDDRFRLIDGLHRIGHAEPFGASDNSDNDAEGRDRYAIDWP